MVHFVLLITLLVSSEHKLRLTATRSGCRLILLVLSVDTDELEKSLLDSASTVSTNVTTGTS